MSAIALVNGVLTILSLVLLVVLLVLVAIRATGRARVAGVVGLSLLVVERLLSPLLLYVYDQLSSSSEGFATFVIVQSVVLTVVGLVATVALALAIIWASRDGRRPAAPSGPPQPGPAGWNASQGQPRWNPTQPGQPGQNPPQPGQAGPAQPYRG